MKSLKKMKLLVNSNKESFLFKNLSKNSKILKTRLKATNNDFQRKTKISTSTNKQSINSNKQSTIESNLKNLNVKNVIEKSKDSILISNHYRISMSRFVKRRKN